MKKLRPETFRHIEGELSNYWETVEEAKILRMELIYQHPFNDENAGGGKTNLPGDPTGSTATVLASHRYLSHMTRVIESIRSVVDSLPNEKYRLVELAYWNRNRNLNWEGIARELNVTRMTAYRWRQEIIRSIAERLGWR